MKRKDPTHTYQEERATKRVLKQLPAKTPYALKRDGVYINRLSTLEQGYYTTLLKYLKFHFKVTDKVHPALLLLLKHICIDFIKIERLNDYILETKHLKEVKELTKLVKDMDDSLAKRVETVYRILGVKMKAQKVNIFKDLRVNLSGKKDLNSDVTPSGYDRRHGFDKTIRTKNE
jgi:hypothetical protein